MQKLYEKYRNQGFSMVAINTVPDQNDKILAWRAKGHYTFTILVADSEDYARVNYGVTGTPTNLILNADGKMVFRHVGFGTRGEEYIEDEIRELLGLNRF